MFDNRRRSSEWVNKNGSPKNFPKLKISNKKLLLTIWWNCDGIIHHKFLNPGETKTSDRHCKEIKEMNQKLSVLKPALVNRRGPILLHDNAKPHVSRITVHKINELEYETLSHSLYSLDLSPTDYHLSKELELHLRQKKFSKSDDLKIDDLEFLDSRDGSFYSNGINRLV
uniref:Mariner Mos1 transposase n=1 Tax=Strongyloides papillosus TaxID=174720 RepID=A0A0N5BH18_STREA